MSSLFERDGDHEDVNKKVLTLTKSIDSRHDRE